MKIVRVDTLRPGDTVTAADGRRMTYERLDGVLSGVHHFIDERGFSAFYAGCASVAIGWHNMGWFKLTRLYKSNGYPYLVVAPSDRGLTTVTESDRTKSQ